jgi:hypothetical protein
LPIFFWPAAAKTPGSAACSATLSRAIREVEEHYGRLEEDVFRFFPDLVEFVHGVDRQDPGTESEPA